MQDIKKLLKVSIIGSDDKTSWYYHRVDDDTWREITRDGYTSCNACSQGGTVCTECYVKYSDAYIQSVVEGALADGLVVGLQPI